MLGKTVLCRKDGCMPLERGFDGVGVAEGACENQLCGLKGISEVPVVILDLSSDNGHWLPQTNKPQISKADGLSDTLRASSSNVDTDSTGCVNSIKNTVNVRVLDALGAPLQLDKGKSEQSIAEYYGALLRHEQEQRHVVEDKLKEERAALLESRAAHQTRMQHLTEERSLLLQEVEDKTRAVDLERMMLTSKMEKKRASAQRERERLMEQIRQTALCERSLLKEVSSLVLQREAWKKDISRMQQSTPQTPQRSAPRTPQRSPDRSAGSSTECLAFTPRTPDSKRSSGMQLWAVNQGQDLDAARVEDTTLQGTTAEDAAVRLFHDTLCSGPLLGRESRTAQAIEAHLLLAHPNGCMHQDVVEQVSLAETPESVDVADTEYLRCCSSSVAGSHLDGPFHSPPRDRCVLEDAEDMASLVLSLPSLEVANCSLEAGNFSPVRHPYVRHMQAYARRIRQPNCGSP